VIQITTACQKLQTSFPLHINRQKLEVKEEEDKECTCNVTLWRVRVIFVPTWLLQQPEAISLEEGAFMAMKKCVKIQNFCPILNKFGFLEMVSIKDPGIKLPRKSIH
jgi:hypothetical protein